ncbi:hypothetical protein ACFWWC_45535 [Streptomyces sp. NPDC058642]|uniref:hypothetical protein n=1 Tax=Streptomyces sp. NPDC058642 TaxID=3346572 RepID=UPI00365C48DE
MNAHVTRTRAVLTAVGVPTAYATLDDGTIEKERSYELTLLHPVARGGWTTGPGSTSDGMGHVPERLARENYRR